MSLLQPGNSDPQRSAGLTINLASNNPFRNRAISPNGSDKSVSPREPPPRPVSRNPFLDPATNDYFKDSFNMSQPKGSQPSTPLTGHAAELFDNLTLGDEKPKVTTERRPSLNTESTSRPRGPPPPRPAAHKPSRSQEEDPRARKPSSGNRPRPAKEDVLDIFADPDEKPKKHEARRPRRNSESSVMERKPLDTEEERKRHERKRRERKEREMREKGPKKPNRKLDVIDKLDLSSIYGTGLFHHDGPFDACNPHRNRQGSKRAPMQAFPEGSLNNSLSGGPIEKRADHSTFMGRADDEAYNDYGVAIDKSRTGKEPTVINSTSRVEPIHGDESLGLGTSTFLEGAPASRTAIKQLESERQEQLANGGGLSRKKSLAQKIRGVGPRRGEYGGRMNGHEGAYSPTSPPLPTNSSSRSNGDNPFDFDFGNEGRDRKFGSVSNESGRPKGADVRERLERRATDDVLSYGDKENGSRPAPPPPPGGGFLSRVKSLKGGPRKPSRSIPQPES